jgi:hypothetical protein
MNSVLDVQLLYSDFSNLQYRKIIVDMTGTITVGCWCELKYNTCLRYFTVFTGHFNSLYIMVQLMHLLVIKH